MSQEIMNITSKIMRKKSPIWPSTTSPFWTTSQHSLMDSTSSALAIIRPQKNNPRLRRQLTSHDMFNLLMVHQPSMWHHAPEKTDLMLSGHTHNGQIFPFNLLVRMQFRTVYGIYRRMNSSLYVSSGSGTWGPRMRLGTQNEIIQISISPEGPDHRSAR